MATGFQDGSIMSSSSSDDDVYWCSLGAFANVLLWSFRSGFFLDLFNVRGNIRNLPAKLSSLLVTPGAVHSYFLVSVSHHVVAVSPAYCLHDCFRMHLVCKFILCSGMQRLASCGSGPGFGNACSTRSNMVCCSMPTHYCPPRLMREYNSFIFYTCTYLMCSRGMFQVQIGRCR